jgi:nicotinamidase-related amidase
MCVEAAVRAAVDFGFEVMFAHPLAMKGDWEYAAA